MFDIILDMFGDPFVWVRMLVSLATIATCFTLLYPFIVTDTLETRMKYVAFEREQLRKRDRERALEAKKDPIRKQANGFVKRTVEQFNLLKWLGSEEVTLKLAQAGYRGSRAYFMFLFLQFILPLACVCVGFFYAFVVFALPFSLIYVLGIFCVSAYIGLKIPDVFIKNQMNKRQLDIKRAFPDMLDLLLVCVEAGMSPELAFKKVAKEVGLQSIPLAEELTLFLAELSFLPDRQLAYQNLAQRTGLDIFFQMVTVLLQAEKFGTSLGASLRNMSKETRVARLLEAEKKAAALPPKLTVPMILFFLPVLFAVVITPTVLKVIPLFGK